MRKHLKCGHLFDGLSDELKPDQTVVIEDDLIAFVGPSSEAPPLQTGDLKIDHGNSYVLPGLIDIHVHLSYGNAQANEDVDMFAPPEYRALRALHAAGKVLKAGYTSLAGPGIDQPGVSFRTRCHKLGNLYRTKNHQFGPTDHGAARTGRLVSGMDRCTGKFRGRPCPKSARSHRGNPHAGQGSSRHHQVLRSTGYSETETETSSPALTRRN